MMRNNSTKTYDLVLILTIFVNGLVLNKGFFEFYFHYLFFIVFNLIWIFKYGLPLRFLSFLIILGAIGIVHVFLDNNSLNNLFKIFFGFILAYFFYYFIFKAYKLNVYKLFNVYLKGAYIIAILGVFQFISYLFNFDQGVHFFYIFNKISSPIVEGDFRLNSLLMEPSSYAMTMAPAIGICLFVLFIDRKKKKTLGISNLKIIIFLSTYFLTFSSVAFIGIALFVLLYIINNFNLMKFFWGGLFLIVFSIITYKNVELIQKRIDSSFELMTKRSNDFSSSVDVSQYNASSFILYDNFNVAIKNLIAYPFTGTGFGSHEYAFEKYSIVSNLGLKWWSGNTKDGNSMLVRIISETGLLGLIITICFIFRFYISRKSAYDDLLWIISNGTLVLILLYLLRQGNYFIQGFPFFVWLYYYTFKVNKKQIKQAYGDRLFYLSTTI